MTPDQYEQMKQQLLLLGSLVNQTSLEELVEFVEFVEKSEAIGIGDREKWEKVRGDTDLLQFLARRFIDIKSILPPSAKNQKAAPKRTKIVKLPVRAQLDGAGGDQDGTVVIDPTLGTVTVRPSRKRSVYTRTLREVADFICKSVMLGRKI